MSNIKMPVVALEVQEYLFAANIPGATPETIKAMRECFYFHRFQVMNWLLMNGVSLPAHLISDQTHPRIGLQTVDAENGTLKNTVLKIENSK